MDPKKIQAMKKWSLPKSLETLRGFLELISCYRIFVSNYGKVVAPLIALTKNNAVTWLETTTLAFSKFKEAICCTPVLVMPKFSKSFVIEYDSSRNGIDVVLIQEGHPLAFESEHLLGRNLGKSTY